LSGEELSPDRMINRILMIGRSIVLTIAIPRPLERVWVSINGSETEGKGSGRGGDLRNLSCELNGDVRIIRSDRAAKKRDGKFLKLFGQLILFRF
jgi:hypothetical protein